MAAERHHAFSTAPRQPKLHLCPHNHLGNWETGREWGAAGAHPGLRLGGQHHTLGRTSKRSVCVETWRSVSGMDQVSGEGSRCAHDRATLGGGGALGSTAHCVCPRRSWRSARALPCLTRPVVEAGSLTGPQLTDSQDGCPPSLGDPPVSASPVLGHRCVAHPWIFFKRGMEGRNRVPHGRQAYTWPVGPPPALTTGALRTVTQLRSPAMPGGRGQGE